MKTKLTLIAFLMSMLFINNAEAQFLKKLKKTVEDAVEQTVINKTADKASEKASQSMDKVFNPNFGGGKQGKKVTPQNLPENFSFEYKYQLQISSGKDQMSIDYMLKPGASYMGVSMNIGPKMFMVMDGTENITYMFMESKDSKICTATSLDVSEELDDEFNDLEGYTITNLPNKTFLDFDCQGMQMESDDYVIIIYFTNDAPVTFNDVFKSDPDRIPPALRSHFKDNQNALMMYMDMKDKKNKGKKNTSGTMECTALETISYELNTAGYQLL